MSEGVMALVEGQVELFLRTEGGRVSRVRLASSRPVTACRILLGRPVAEVPRLVSLLYSVCGQAQTLTALTACEAALGIDAAPVINRQREILALAEAMREHAWRLLLDWPDLMGEEPAVGLLQAIVQALTKLPRDLCPEGVCWRLGGEGEARGVQSAPAVLSDLDRLLERELLGQPMPPRRVSDSWPFLGATRWLRETVRAQGLENLGASGVKPLPALPLPELDTMLARDENDEMVTRPTWRGGVHETGPLARMASQASVAALIDRYGGGLLARLAARLLELLELPAMMRARWRGEPGPWQVEAFSPAAGIGLAVVETARGRLAHRVELSGDRVRRYQVLAPTEWNFHPEGPLVGGLINLSAENQATLERHTTMAVMALDPCVGYRVNVA